MCGSKDSILFALRRLTMQFWQRHWLMASPVNFTAAFLLLVQTGLVFLICCPALIVNIILLSYIHFLLDTVQPLPKKTSEGSKIFYYLYGQVISGRQTLKPTVQAGQGVENFCRQFARICVLALPFTAYMIILPIFILSMFNLCST